MLRDDQPTMISRIIRPLATLGAPGALVLTGCHKVPDPPRDYCEVSKRTLSQDERFALALTSILASGHFRASLPHLWAFNDHVMAQQSDARPHDVARQYLEENPDCCEVTLPWVYQNYPLVGDTEHFDDMVRGSRKSGVNRVIVVRDPPGRRIPFADKQVREGQLADPDLYRRLVQQTACGNAKRIRPSTQINGSL